MSGFKTLPSCVTVVVAVTASACVNELFTSVHTIQLHYLLTGACAFANLAALH